MHRQSTERVRGDVEIPPAPTEGMIAEASAVLESIFGVFPDFLGGNWSWSVRIPQNAIQFFTEIILSYPLVLE